MSNNQQQGNLKQALVAGACAGTAVDTALFPLGNLTFPKKTHLY
jgi:solute carrier family 25 S-adenosylmethionine transporter 26